MLFYLLIQDPIVWPRKEVPWMAGTTALEASPFFSYCIFGSTPLWLIPTGWLGDWWALQESTAKGTVYCTVKI
jgi:hypothetical protein